LVVILAGSYVAGGADGGALFDFGRLSDGFLPGDWDWGPTDIVMLFGCFGLAQWSGCAWETAALYGPEYKDPNKDVPKALFFCGLICLALYFFVSLSTFGSLSVTDIEANGYATMVPIAEAVFGDFGGPIAIGLLISAMVLIIQTGFLGSSRTLYYMSEEGNLPKFLKKKNKFGMPFFAMLTVSGVNMILILTATVQIGDFVGGPVMILAASAVAYCIAHVIALSAYVKSKRDPRFKDLPRPFSAPKGWMYVAVFMVFYEAFVLIPCLIYWMNELYGALTMIVGTVILLAFIPLWFYTQKNSSEEITAAESA
jgi:amino acid transporter